VFAVIFASVAQGHHSNNICIKIDGQFENIFQNSFCSQDAVSFSLFGKLGD